jgi:outer membrane protein insertion porin family
LNHELSYNEELSNRSNPRLPDSLLAYNVSAYSISGNYTRGFQRGEGWVLSGFAEVSSPFGLSDYRYQKLSMDLRRFHRSGNGAVVATRFDGGAILFADADSLPSSILFFNGGTQTVRGWSRESLGPKRAVLDSTSDGGVRFSHYVPTGGRIMMAASAELRHGIPSGRKGWGMAWFVDAGQVWRKPDDVLRQSMRIGVGTGVSYDSPIGPIRLDLAWKVNPSDEDLDVYQGVRYGSWWNRFGLHLNVGGPL